MKKQGVFTSAMACVQRGLWWAYDKAYTVEDKEVQDPQGLIHFIWMMCLGMRLWLVYQVSWVYLCGAIVACLVIIKGVDVGLLSSHTPFIYDAGAVIAYGSVFCMIIALFAFIEQCFQFGAKWLTDFLTRHIVWVYVFAGVLAIFLIGNSLWRGTFLFDIQHSFQDFLEHIATLLRVIALALIDIFILVMTIVLPASITGYMTVWLYQKLPEVQKQFFKMRIQSIVCLVQKTTITIQPPHNTKE